MVGSAQPPPICFRGLPSARIAGRAAAGGVAGGGAGVAALKNQNGVEMGQTATAQGVRLSIAQGGVGVKLKK